MASVFISHATQDNAIANEIYEMLSAAGVRSWLDNVDVNPETDWLIQVEKAVKESSHGLFLLSPAAVKSPSAMDEYHKLLMDDKPLYVALIEPLTGNELPYYLRDVSYCDLTEDFETGVKCLIRLLQSGDTLESNAAQTTTREEESRDITITLQANLRDLDTDKFVSLISRLVDVGIKDIKVINVTAG